MRRRKLSPQSSVLPPQSSVLFCSALLLILDNRGKLFRGWCPGQHAAIDDHRGRRIHPNTVRFFNVLAHKLFCPSFVHASIEIGGVEPSGDRVGFQIRTAVDFVLIHKQLVGILPEFPLFSSAFGGVRSQARRGMHLLGKARITFVVQRVVVKDDPGVGSMFL